jgi:TonB family protein
MVRLLFFILALAITSPLLGQNKCDSVSMFPNPEELPVFDKDFLNDITKLSGFLMANLQYPKPAREDGIVGEVHVQFWIDTNGFTMEHKIIQGVRQDLDDEALRIAKLIKFDIPAKNNGQSVGTCLTLPVRFSISGNDKPSKHTIKQAKKAKTSHKSN